MKEYIEEYTELKQKGFTLIEVIISLSVLSLLMFGMINLTQNTQEVAFRVTGEDREMLHIETALSRFEWDFSQIYSPMYFSHIMNPEGMSEAEGEVYNQLIDRYQNNNRFSLLSYDGIPVPLYRNSDKSTLIFFTNSNRRKIENVKQSNFAWVKYSLIRDELKDTDDAAANTGAQERVNSMAFVRQVLTHDVFNKNQIEWDRVKTQVLLRKVISLKFEFWNPATEKWTDNIDTIQQGSNIIHATKITLRYYDPDNQERVTVRIYRPLYPEFTPEDMYKFLNATKPQTGGNGSSNNGNGSSNNGNGSSNNGNGSSNNGNGSSNGGAN